MALALLLMATLTGILVAILILWPSGESAKTAATGERRASTSLPDSITTAPVVGGERNEGKTSTGSRSIVERGGAIALIVDDAGNDLSSLEQFLRFPGEMSIAVLPQLPYSRQCAVKAHEAGKEVLLHLPLEPLGSENPGPGAVLVSFDRNRIRDVLDMDFSTVPFAQGVNNHMGSLATQDRAVMDTLLSYLKEKNKYFIDSRTVSSTLGREYAERYAVRWAERNFFLDNSAEKEDILRVLNDGVAYARLHGRAILIGHVQHRALLNVLLEQYDDLVASGVRFVTASEFLRLKGEGGK
ncbi:MAG: divergent polysaccharide deacetylase family protein [Spirochaetales bacterium]|nr:divergent polysaccharide deacetylase family protein [Spirochaetales bacterium]